MSSEPEGLRLSLHAVRCVYDAEGHPRTKEAPQGACKCCLKAYPVPGADEQGAWLVRPFYQTQKGKVLEVGNPVWACHLCLSMWDDGINAEGVYDL
jgi:hypothetical protein